jgi:hypothetical protein
MDYSPPDLFPGAHPHSGWGPIFIVRAMDRVRVDCRWGAASDGMATGFRSVCGCRDWRDCAVVGANDRIPRPHGVLEIAPRTDPHPDVRDYPRPDSVDRDDEPRYAESTQLNKPERCP